MTRTNMIRKEHKDIKMLVWNQRRVSFAAFNPTHWVKKIWTSLHIYSTFQKHTYSSNRNIKIQKISSPKTENFQMKNSAGFQISAKNINYRCSLEPPRRDGSNEYLQFMFLSRNKKNNVYPVNPSFTITKVGFKRVKII